MEISRLGRVMTPPTPREIIADEIAVMFGDGRPHTQHADGDPGGGGES